MAGGPAPQHAAMVTLLAHAAATAAPGVAAVVAVYRETRRSSRQVLAGSSAPLLGRSPWNLEPET